MSELETARAGVFLSILTLTLTWLLMSNADDARSVAPDQRPLAVCASTHGAICDAVPSASIAAATAAGFSNLGEIVVTASRLPAPLGRMVVSASRLPAEPFSKVRLADARGGSEGRKAIVVQ